MLLHYWFLLGHRENFHGMSQIKLTEKSQLPGGGISKDLKIPGEIDREREKTTVQ